MKAFQLVELSSDTTVVCIGSVLFHAIFCCHGHGRTGPLLSTNPKPFGPCFLTYIHGSSGAGSFIGWRSSHVFDQVENSYNGILTPKFVSRLPNPDFTHSSRLSSHSLSSFIFFPLVLPVLSCYSCRNPFHSPSCFVFTVSFAFRSLFYPPLLPFLASVLFHFLLLSSLSHSPVTASFITSSHSLMFLQLFLAIESSTLSRGASSHPPTRSCGHLEALVTSLGDC